MATSVHLSCEATKFAFRSPYNKAQTVSTFLTNDGMKRIGLKIRTTDNNIFRVNKVYFLLEPGAKEELQLRLLPLGLQFNFLCRNHITFLYGQVDDSIKNPKQAWKSIKDTDQFSVRVTIEKPHKGDPVAQELRAVGAKKHFDASSPVCSRKEAAEVATTGEGRKEELAPGKLGATSAFSPAAAGSTQAASSLLMAQDIARSNEDMQLKTAELVEEVAESGQAGVAKTVPPLSTTIDSAKVTP
ncbi:Major sperm protein [Trichuris trichiura]|uniref:Major sperm protein n=1 Tax=Trichuris trichiura TaxID=36087 RepID=A0A077ZBX0_TRITR|nr:Major sperm protein [Trichuris trichiura]